MHAYILEHDNESERLEKQNSLKNYCVSEELKNIEITSQMSVLDAGCGTGAITRHILNHYTPHKMTAIDFSETRLAQAKKLTALECNTSDIIFKRVDMLNEKLEEDQFDLIISRFVMHHLTNPQMAVTMLAKALKPNGRLCIIDSDGIMFNLYSKDKWLQQALRKVKQNLSLDMFVGRKLRAYMDSATLMQLESRIIPMHFTGSDLQNEKLQYQERFYAMRDLLSNILGKDADKFIEHYLAAFDDSSTEVFYNKFVCQGVSK